METLAPDPSPQTLATACPAISASDSAKTLASADIGASKTLDFGAKTLEFGAKTLDFGEGAAKTLDFGGSVAKDAISGRFVAGDLVWGKIKGKQWWPGIISDPSTVVNEAKKAESGSEKGEAFYVSFFGDSGFGWCGLSEIKHFVEEFGKLVKSNKSKDFVEAVNEAVEEFRRFAERELTCECIPVENRDLRVGRVGRGMLNSKEILELLRVFACDVMAVNSVEIALLKCWVIGFGKGWSDGSPGYHRRRRIDELVDKIDLDVPLGELEDDKEVEEDVEKRKRSLSKKSSRSVKRKSMTKLIAEMDLETVEVIDGEDMKVEEKKGSKNRSGKRKPVADNGKDLGVDDSGFAKVETDPVKRERKKSKYSSPRRPGKDFGVDDSVSAKAVEETGSAKRERKRSKYLSPRKPVADKGKDLGVDVSGFVKAEEETDSVKRERKKSKYLSPPYTNLGARDISSFASPKSVEVKSESAKTEMEEDVTSELLKLESVSADCLLLELRRTALDAFYLKRCKLGKTVQVFFTKYRSSMYSSGSDFVKCQKKWSESCAEDLKSPSSTGQANPGVKNSKRKYRSKDNPETGFSPDSVNSSQKSKASCKKKMAGNEAEGKTSNVIDAQIVDVPVLSAYENKNSKDRDHGENAVLFPEPVSSCQLAKESEELLKGKETSNDGSVEVHGSSGRSRVGKSGPKKKKAAVVPNDTQLDLGQIQRTNEGEELLNGKENTNGESAVVHGSSGRSRVGKSGPKKKKVAVVPNDTQSDLGQIQRTNEGEELPNGKENTNGESAVVHGSSGRSRGRPKKNKAAVVPFDLGVIQRTNEGEEVLKGKEMPNGGSDVVHGSSSRRKSGPKKKAVAVPICTQMDLGQIQRTNEDGIENRNPGALLMNFAAGVCFPSRDELISTFRKFGVVIESETEMQKETGFARIVFAKSTDAEKAYNCSDKVGIFCPPHVTYRLRYLPPITSSPPLATPQKPPLPFIRENLERMISTLTSSASPLKSASPSEGLKSETKENLVGDMEGLLKKVNMMLNSHAAGASS